MWAQVLSCSVAWGDLWVVHRIYVLFGIQDILSCNRKNFLLRFPLLYCVLLYEFEQQVASSLIEKNNLGKFQSLLCVLGFSLQAQYTDLFFHYEA